MENGTPVIISNKKFEIGTEVMIGADKFRVLNIYPGRKDIFFAKVLASGDLAKPGPTTMGTYNFDQIANYITIGAIV